MKLTLPGVAAASVLALPGLALAKPVTIQAQMKDYGGNNAYVVVYVTDSAGQYRGTLWMAGRKSRYYRHLSDWERASGGSPAEVDGITGASVGSGRTLKVSVDLADALIDAGYTIHVDTAVEDGQYNVAEGVAPLSSAASGKPVAGKGYVKTFSVTF